MQGAVLSVDPGLRRPGADEVLRVVRLNLASIEDTSEISMDTNLWDLGMDSLDNISIMIALEDEFGIVFPDELLTQDLFASPRRIAEAVCSLAFPDAADAQSVRGER
jgi:acyl carrier protein